MSQHYFDEKRASEPTALPDLETFELTAKNQQHFEAAEGGGLLALGWYWWPCLPGCLPDGDPSGPFPTEAEALADARSIYEDVDEELADDQQS